MVLLILIQIRSGLFEAGPGISTVTVPSDLAFRSAVASRSSKQRTSGKSGLLDPPDIIRDPVTDLAIDGREQLMFLLSTQVMQQLVTLEHAPSEEQVTAALWNRFCEEADISVVSARGALDESMMPQQRPGQDCRNLIAVRMTLYLAQTERYLLQVRAR